MAYSTCLSGIWCLQLSAACSYPARYRFAIASCYGIIAGPGRGGCVSTTLAIKTQDPRRRARERDVRQASRRDADLPKLATYLPTYLHRPRNTVDDGTASQVQGPPAHLLSGTASARRGRANRSTRSRVTWTTCVRTLPVSSGAWLPGCLAGCHGWLERPGPQPLTRPTPEMFKTFVGEVAPRIRAAPALARGVQVIFRQQVQPWHPSSTLTHEAGLAVQAARAGPVLGLQRRAVCGAEGLLRRQRRQRAAQPDVPAAGGAGGRERRRRRGRRVRPARRAR